MQVVSQKISAVHASVAVKDSKIGRFLPFGDVFRFYEIEDNCHSIFVVLAYRTLVGRSRVGANGAMRIFGMFGRLEIRDGDKGLGESRMLILIIFDSSVLITIKPRLYVNLFPDNLIDVFDRRFRFGTRLILVAIFNC